METQHRYCNDKFSSQFLLFFITSLDFDKLCLKGSEHPHQRHNSYSFTAKATLSDGGHFGNVTVKTSLSQQQLTDSPGWITSVLLQVPPYMAPLRSTRALLPAEANL